VLETDIHSRRGKKKKKYKTKIWAGGPFDVIQDNDTHLIPIFFFSESYEEMKKATINKLLKANTFKSNLVRELDSIFSCYDTTLPHDHIPPATFEHLRTDASAYTLSMRLLNVVRSRRW
jgi:hypothetical protein